MIKLSDKYRHRLDYWKMLMDAAEEDSGTHQIARRMVEKYQIKMLAAMQREREAENGQEHDDCMGTESSPGKADAYTGH